MQRNLKFLENNTWAEKVNNHIFGDRVTLFQILGVSKQQMENFLFTNQIVETPNGNFITMRSLRTFHSLPKWLKKRMKYRLHHGYDAQLDPHLEFLDFVENLSN